MFISRRLDQTLARKANRTIPSRKRLWPQRLFWSACGFVVFAVLSFCAGVFWLRSAAIAALPQLDGDLHISSLSAPIIVRRDAHGVPHIEASNENDLFLAQGYITAQDRLWQMDLYRRNADGNLAEILGPALVRHDKTQRVLQFRNIAQRVYGNLPAAERARLDAYARGVNLFIAQHQDTLPPEFKLLFYRPHPWSGVDSISIGLMMVQMLDTHWYDKLAREQIAAKLHNPQLEADLYPTGSWRDHPPTGQVLDLSKPHPEPPDTGNEEEDDGPAASAALSNLPPLPAPPSQDVPPSVRALLGLSSCRDCAAGSNNWVIAGSHTASGQPLLSNDMHLSLTEPNIWYMADLKSDGPTGYHAAGIILPGMTYVIAGHNDHVAWGFTALMADVQDLYVERLDSKGDYQAPDGSWKPLTVDHEVIHVRGGRDVQLNVQLTDHGPLVNPILEKEKRPIALRWTLYDPTLNSIPLYQLDTASNWANFSAALSTWCWPTQNVVYADDQGHIAYQAVGRVPLRPAGLMGVPIQDDAHEWQGYIPFGQMPNAVDPPSGFLATANSRVTSDLFPAPLTLEWTDPYRIERIYKSLQGHNQLKPADMLALQIDIYSEVDQEIGQRLAYAIDHTSGVDAQLRQAADLLRGWNGRLTTSSAAASIVTRARAALWPLILEPKLGKLAADYHWEESNFAEEEIIMNENPGWLPPGYADWTALLTEAVRHGMKSGHTPADVSNWAYGSWHVVDIEHPLAAFLPFIGRIAETGSQPLSGDTTTVKQVSRDFGPSQRFTMDWSNIDGSTENIVLGESGNPYSPYFRDQWPDYYAGRTFALPFTPSAVAAQTRHTLRLLP